MSGTGSANDMARGLLRTKHNLGFMWKLSAVIMVQWAIRTVRTSVNGRCLRHRIIRPILGEARLTWQAITMVRPDTVTFGVLPLWKP